MAIDFSKLVGKDLTPEEAATLDAKLAETKTKLADEHADVARDLAQQRLHIKSFQKIVGDDYAEVIAFFHQRTRNFYKGSIPEPGKHPDCSSPDGKVGYGDNLTGTIGKHDCETCPLAKWGSSTKGDGKGQACRLVRFVAIHRLDPRDATTPEIETLQIPPTSLRNWANTIEEAIKKGKPYFAFKIGVHLETSKGGDPVGFTFELGDELSRPQLAAALQVHEDQKVAMQAFLERAAAFGIEGDTTTKETPKLLG